MSIATQVTVDKHTALQSDSVVHPPNVPYFAAVFGLRVQTLQPVDVVELAVAEVLSLSVHIVQSK